MIDENSETWRDVKAWAEKRIGNSRNAVEARGLPPEDTEFERGRISALRELMNLAAPKPELQENITEY